MSTNLWQNLDLVRTSARGLEDNLTLHILDYIDLFLIHDPLSGPERRLETYKALQECRQAGKIRAVGVSN